MNINSYFTLDWISLGLLMTHIHIKDNGKFNISKFE